MLRERGTHGRLIIEGTVLKKQAYMVQYSIPVDTMLDTTQLEWLSLKAILHVITYVITATLRLEFVHST